jgi:hypothetical protein
MTQSLHGFCNAHDLSKATVHRWLKKQGYDLSNGMSPDAIDAALAQFVPMQAEVVESTPEAVDGQIQRFSSRTNPLVPIHIDTLNLNITQANTRQLEAETARFHHVSAAALQGIGEFIQADLVSNVQGAIAQNRHAVAGLNAQAASNLANSLGKSPHVTVEGEDDV